MRNRLGLGVTALISALLGTDAHAGLIDPNGVLAQADAYFAPAAFTETYRAGDQAKIRLFRKDCRFGCQADFGCMAVCQTVQDIESRVVSECSEESATVIEGDGSEIPVSRAEFERAAGNPLRAELEQLAILIGLGGDTELTEFKPAAFALADGTAIDARELSGVHHAPGGDLNFIYSVTRDLPGVARLLSFNLLDMKIFKVREFARRSGGGR